MHGRSIAGPGGAPAAGRQPCSEADPLQAEAQPLAAGGLRRHPLSVAPPDLQTAGCGVEDTVAAREREVRGPRTLRQGGPEGGRLVAKRAQGRGGAQTGFRILWPALRPPEPALDQLVPARVAD